MRVLHVIKGLGPGGAERLLVSLTGSRADDVDVDVAYLVAAKAQLVPELEASGAAVHLIGGRRGLGDPAWPARLARLIRRTRPDVVHLHSPAVAAVVRPMLRARRGRPVVISTEHNVWPAFGRLTRLVNAVTLPLDDATLAVSEHVRASASPRLHGGIEVLVQGIPVARLSSRIGERDQARSDLGLATDDVLVLTVANFREKKDYPTLLRAAAECRDDPRLRFAVIGQGPLEGDIRALRERLGLADRVQLLGYHPDPAAVLAGADLFTLTSRHEGLPIALLEAMALSVPPVVSRVGGIPEVVTDGVDGRLVEAGRPDLFAAAYRELAADGAQRRKLGEAASRRASEFDIARTQRSLEARYRALLGDGGVRGPKGP